MSGFIEGDKNIFAVEFIDGNLNMARFLVWINGIYLGAGEDDVLTKAFLYLLHELAEFHYVSEFTQDPEILNENVSYCINRFIDTDDCPGEVMALGYENLDDFTIRCFRYTDHYLFLWKKYEEAFYSYPGYPEGVHSAKVDSAFLVDVITKFTQRMHAMFPDDSVPDWSVQVAPILRISIDDEGRLCVTPEEASFPQIYREAKEVHWDSEKRFLYTPKPRELSYLDWFQRIVETAKEQSYRLTISSHTQWFNISDDLKAEITNWMKTN